MNNDKFEVVYKISGTESEITTMCNSIEEFMKLADMYVKKMIDIVSVNGIPVENVEHIEVVEDEEK